MDLTLKDESVVDIGRAVGDNVNSMIPQSQALVPAGGATAPAVVEPMPMNPFDSMMVVLSDIRDGIYSLVDKFSEGVSLQKDQMQDAAMAQDLAQVGGDEADTSADTEPTDDRSFLQKGKDKIKDLMGRGGFMGLLIKGGLIAGLLGLATLLKKYGAQIAEVIAPIVDGIKAFYSYVKDDIGEFFSDVFNTVKETVTGIVNIFKGIFGGDGDLLRDGLAELLALPAKFVSMVGKLALGILDSFLKVFGIEETPEWLQKMYDFLDELPAKVKEFFVSVMEFFTVTIPEKIQAAKDTVTQWFTDTVAGVKQFFTDVGNFFTVTIPTKLTEAYNNVTTFFSDIVLGIKGFFTDAFNYVTVEVPNKVADVTKSIGDKFSEIKQDIIDFAMAPFKKIKELMQNLLVGILESVEGLPFIGDKAKALKEKILGEGSGATETIQQTGGDASVAEQTYTDTANLKVPTSEDGTVLDPKTNKMLKIRDEDAAKIMAGELTASGTGIYEPVYDDGGYFGRAFYKIKKVGVASGGDFTTTGAGTTSGGDVNAMSVEAQQGFGTNGGTNVDASNNAQSTNIVNQSTTHMSEDTVAEDKGFFKSLFGN